MLHPDEHDAPLLDAVASDGATLQAALVALGLFACIAVYALGLRRLWCTAGVGRGVRAWEATAYVAGVTTALLATSAPVAALSDVMFSIHMTQHEVLMVVAAPLVVLGRPLVPALWALPAGLRLRVAGWLLAPRVRRAWRLATAPLCVVVVHGAILWIWHAPRFFEAALDDQLVHALQHASFFVSAALFWWSLVHGRYGRAGYGVAVLYVFATALHSTVLGALITVAGAPFYQAYVRQAERHHIDAFQDQQLAGLIMWVPAGVLFLVIGLALFAAWVAASERRRPGPALGVVTHRGTP